MDIKAAPIARLLAFGLLLLSTVPAAGESARPISVAPMIGFRDFDSDLGLNGEISFGARFGVDTSPRFGLLMDFIYAQPSRETTGTPANVTAIRGLARYRILAGSVRPYLVAGVGGVLFDFRDSFDTGSITLTLGGGADYRLGGKTSLFAEFSADGYRARTVTYSSTGQEVESTERDTQAVLAGTLGVAVEF
jgi:hypothetical protein